MLDAKKDSSVNMESVLTPVEMLFVSVPINVSMEYVFRLFIDGFSIQKFQ